MKKHLIIIVALLSVACLLIATVASLERAKTLPKPPATEGETEQATAPDSQYDINYEREAELGRVFTDVCMTMEVTSVVWVRTEPSALRGDATKVPIQTYAGMRVTCIGYGQDWHRVLIDGKVCYMSAEYLRVVEE